MKKFFAAPVLLALTVLGAAFVGPGSIVPAAQAAGKFKAPVIAVLDIDRILSESVAAQQLDKQAQAQEKKWTDELGKSQKELEAQVQELQRQATVLTDDKLKEKREELQKKAIEVEGLRRQRSRQLQNGIQAGLREVDGALKLAAQKLAVANQIDLVVAKGAMVYVGDDLDITADVLVELNKRLPSVKLKIEN